MTGEEKFQAVLRGWATSYARELNLVPADAKIVAVEMEYEPGYSYSEYTYENPSVKVYVTFERPDGSQGKDYIYGEEESEGALNHLLTALLQFGRSL